MFCVVMSSATMEPESPEGEWPPGPAKFYGLTSLPHLEALGVIAAIYNHLEYTLFLLIWIYSRLEGQSCQITICKYDKSGARQVPA
jgi:hypothetical protein